MKFMILKDYVNFPMRGISVMYVLIIMPSLEVSFLCQNLIHFIISFNFLFPLLIKSALLYWTNWIFLYPSLGCIYYLQVENKTM